MRGGKGQRKPSDAQSHLRLSNCSLRALDLFRWLATSESSGGGGGS